MNPTVTLIRVEHDGAIRVRVVGGDLANADAGRVFLQNL